MGDDLYESTNLLNRYIVSSGALSTTDGIFLAF